jgi:hypothetical protein
MMTDKTLNTAFSPIDSESSNGGIPLDKFNPQAMTI